MCFAHAEEEQLEKLRRKTPSGRYVDPASVFRFHGYTSPSTGDNEGGFRNDAALFVGGEPLEGVGSVIELHFVGDASNPVLTEGKLSWDLGEYIGNDNLALRLVGGR